MVNTPQYGLAKHLESIIKSNVPSTNMLRSTQDFVSKLSNMKLDSSCKLVSYDVESLFTNVPLAEVIDIACDYVYSDRSQTKPTFEKQHFKKLLQTATSGECLYKDK